MPYQSPFLQLTYGGGLYNDTDIWSNGFKFPINPDFEWDSDAIAAKITALTPIIQAFHNNPDTLVTSHALLEWIKIAYVGMDGKYIDVIGNPVVTDVTPTAGGVTAAIPPQLSVVVSLTTDYTRGHAKAGRFYLPAAGVVGVDGYIIPTTVNELADLARTFIEDVNDAMSNSDPNVQDLCIMSKITPGTSRRVTGIRVGNVVDTQRRRRNNFVETYTTRSISE